MRPLLYAGAYVLITRLARARNSLPPPVGNFNRLNRSFAATPARREERNEVRAVTEAKTILYQFQIHVAISVKQFK